MYAAAAHYSAAIDAHEPPGSESPEDIAAYEAALAPHRAARDAAYAEAQAAYDRAVAACAGRSA
jgi:hypothetical protein